MLQYLLHSLVHNGVKWIGEQIEENKKQSQNNKKKDSQKKR